MRGLARLLREQPGAIEADLAYRGEDLRNLFRKGSQLTPRRLLVLIENLPPDSRTAIAQNGGKLALSSVDHLLMDLFHGVTGKAHPAKPKRSIARGRSEQAKGRVNQRLLAQERRRQARVAGKR